MEDNELVASCLRGDVEEFKAIVEKYGSPALATALNILGNRDDAEDACQEAFIQVFRNLDRFDMQRSFKNWLYTILYHRCLDQLKRRRRSSELLKKMKTDSASSFATEPNPFSRDKGLPSHLLHNLSAKERTALSLWANEGFTAKEISEVLRCSASTARVYLFQARKKIKALLEKKDVSLQGC